MKMVSENGRGGRKVDDGMGKVNGDCSDVIGDCDGCVYPGPRMDFRVGCRWLVPAVGGTRRWGLG